MSDKKPELSAAMKNKLEPKVFKKILLMEQNLLLQFLALKEVLENQLLQLTWPLR